MESLLTCLFARADNERRRVRFRDIDGSMEFVFVTMTFASRFLEMNKKWR